MRRLLRTTAIGVILGFFLPTPGPEAIFVYKSAHAETNEFKNLPDWVQSSCCGAQDAHKLRADQVYRNEDGSWHADGYTHLIPNSESIRASQDSSAWAFYNEHVVGPGGPGTGGQGSMYCLFFVPSI